MKYVNTLIGFRELPEEVTLLINISNCPCKCVGCHSEYLANDIGKELNEDSISKLIDGNTGITAVCFMGGDATPKELIGLAEYTKKKYPNIKIGWYSGRDFIHPQVSLKVFDYIKIGHYEEFYGGLEDPNTNQKLFKTIVDKESNIYMMLDITADMHNKINK